MTAGQEDSMRKLRNRWGTTLLLAIAAWSMAAALVAVNVAAHP